MSLKRRMCLKLGSNGHSMGPLFDVNNSYQLKFHHSLSVRSVRNADIISLSDIHNVQDKQK